MNLLSLETKRLILTGLSPEDMKYIFDNLPKARIKEILGHRSEADYLKEEQKHKNGYSSYNRSFKLFLLTDKESGKIIGRCGIHNWNMEHKRAEIGYVMEDDSFKNKALMSEAVEAILNYGFKELKLNRIEALVGVENVPSLRILEKNNFKKEGILRQYFWIADKYSDAVLFSILSHEYETRMSNYTTQ
ncbi:MAG TPA: GNAT family protein [Saprospiraceae bacterium]|nr:GNAT family protein [Saprospiraceae bacterium]